MTKLTSNNRLSAIVLNVRNPESLANFYCDTLGMFRQEHADDVALGYGGVGAMLVLRATFGKDSYRHAADHRYWKIAITLPNLDMAHAHLTKRRVAASVPHQFQEIAYMSHLADPEGHVVELIQHTFEGKPRTSDGDTSAPLGGGARIGLVTLRTDDIDAEKRYFLDELNMTYLSRQVVDQRSFDLHFFAFADEQQPNPDVNAVENREWLWQRSYTTLEFQHRLDGETIKIAHGTQLGAATIIVEDGRGNRIPFS